MLPQAPESPLAKSPWHEGERAIQASLGVAETMDRLASRMIRDHMPEQHRAFYPRLPFVIAGVVDDEGAPWATLIEGAAGFVSSPDPRSLRIAASPTEGDPAKAALRTGASVGLLGIELSTRRRNRANGRLTRSGPGGHEVHVEQAFGNCPQHIRLRGLSTAGAPRTTYNGAVERSAGLDAEARQAISAADTFFLASYADVGGDPAARSVDVSHRGGKPGFVRVDGDVLTIPDFSGNRFFNTLGNILLSGRAGLLFVDFTRGDLLQITGSAEIISEGDEVARFEGAERLVRVRVSRMVRRRGAVSLRWTAGELSPSSLATGSWESGVW
ncbi:MAG: pyridoxamine 5'-phosphate oxidase family protein [Polyangiaceae bacterium]